MHLKKVLLVLNMSACHILFAGTSFENLIDNIINSIMKIVKTYQEILGNGVCLLFSLRKYFYSKREYPSEKGFETRNRSLIRARNQLLLYFFNIAACCSLPKSKTTRIETNKSQTFQFSNIPVLYQNPKQQGLKL